MSGFNVNSINVPKVPTDLLAASKPPVLVNIKKDPNDPFQASSSYEVPTPAPPREEDYLAKTKQGNNFEVFFPEIIFNEEINRVNCLDKFKQVLSRELIGVDIFRGFVHRVCGITGAPFTDYWAPTISTADFLVGSMGSLFAKYPINFKIGELPTFDSTKFKTFIENTLNSYLNESTGVRIKRDENLERMSALSSVPFDNGKSYIELFSNSVIGRLEFFSQQKIIFRFTSENLSKLKDKYVAFAQSEAFYDFEPVKSGYTVLNSELLKRDLRGEKRFVDILFDSFMDMTVDIVVKSKKVEYEFLNLYGWLQTPNFKQVWAKVEGVRTVDEIFDKYFRDYFLKEKFFSGLDGAFTRLNLNTNLQIYSTRIVEWMKRQNLLSELVAQLIILNRLSNQTSTVSVKRLTTQGVIVAHLVDLVRAKISSTPTPVFSIYDSDYSAFESPLGSSSSFGPERVKLNYIF